MLRLSPAKLAQLDPASVTAFGHLLETFVVGELMKQASWHDEVREVAHWRTHDDHEVDMLVETYDGSVIGFEVKARSQTNSQDLRGLRKTTRSARSPVPRWFRVDHRSAFGTARGSHVHVPNRRTLASPNMGMASAGQEVVSAGNGSL